MATANSVIKNDFYFQMKILFSIIVCGGVLLFTMAKCTKYPKDNFVEQIAEEVLEQSIEEATGLELELDFTPDSWQEAMKIGNDNTPKKKAGSPEKKVWQAQRNHSYTTGNQAKTNCDGICLFLDVPFCFSTRNSF